MGELTEEGRGKMVGKSVLGDEREKGGKEDGRGEKRGG